MKRLLFATVCLLFLSPYLHSLLLTQTPDFTKDNDNIVSNMDASKCNQRLLNYTSATDVFVHTGVITSYRTNSSDWRYSKFAWAIYHYKYPFSMPHPAYLQEKQLKRSLFFFVMVLLTKFRI